MGELQVQDQTLTSSIHRRGEDEQQQTLSLFIHSPGVVVLFGITLSSFSNARMRWRRSHSIIVHSFIGGVGGVGCTLSLFIKIESVQIHFILVQ